MKSWANRATGVGLVTVVVFCGALIGQIAASHRADGETPVAAMSASPAQSQGVSKDTQPDDSFVIGNDDVLAINVWKEPDLTRSIPVRSDGKISLPLVGDVQAAGRTPSQLEQDITARLRSYITDPQVTVIVQQVNSEKFNILGQVMKPGSYPLTAGTTIVDAIATAGGFRDFAKKKGIYVLRQNPAGGESRIAFNYQAFIKGKIKGKNTTRNIKLRPHDTIVVP